VQATANLLVGQWTPGHINTAYGWSSSGPGRPVENSYIESFNGRLRDECLNVETFFDLADVRDKLERWRQDYNQVRPHSASADRAPEEFARAWQLSSAAALRTAWPADQLPSGAVQSSAAADPKPESFSPHPHPEVKGGGEKPLKDTQVAICRRISRRTPTNRSP
jgi:putative transposase